MAGTSTPPFLAWALARQCELRQINAWEDPERTERQLRAAREFGAAVREGRRQGNLCLLENSQPRGLAFSVSESLRIFGGEQLVQAACQDCPANVLARSQPGSLAGCFGEVPLPQPAGQFYEQVEGIIAGPCLADQIVRLFPVTHPRWFGLWMSPLSGERALVAISVLASLRSETATAWQALVFALVVAAYNGYALHAKLYPRGETHGKQWRLAPYCVHCRAEVADFRRCGTCGAEKLPMPPLKRHVRGTRPYRPQAIQSV